jgi:hypothetical protein
MAPPTVPEGMNDFMTRLEDFAVLPTPRGSRRFIAARSRAVAEKV